MNYVFVLQIHEKLRQYERQSPTPVLHSASSLAEDVSSSHTHTHTHPKLLFHLGHGTQSQWVSSHREATQVSKVNFNVLKVLNHPDTHLMNLHILLLSPVIRGGNCWPKLLATYLPLRVRLCICLCIYSTVNRGVHYRHIHAQVRTRSGLSAHACFVVGRWQRNCRVDQWVQRRRSCCTYWRHHISR